MIEQLLPVREPKFIRVSPISEDQQQQTPLFTRKVVRFCSNTLPDPSFPLIMVYISKPSTRKKLRRTVGPSFWNTIYRKAE
jgi:hypothetical protein